MSWIFHITLLNSFQKSTAESIIGHFEGENADLVVCDGAPDGEPWLDVGGIFIYFIF